MSGIIPTVMTVRDTDAQVKFQCPTCGRTNRHGVPLWDRSSLGHRISHCECYPNGYDLDIIEPVNVKGSKQYNNEYHRCKARKIPFFVVKTRGQRVDVHCDMWPINFDLTPEAVAKCSAVLKQMLQHVRGKNAGFWIGKTGFTIYRVPWGYHVDHVKKLAKIVYEKANHVPIHPGASE